MDTNGPADIGIDLGTTFSVIGVKGKVSLVDGWPQAEYLDECDVSIIPSAQGEKFIPSVVWIDPSDPSVILVGSEAKQKAEEGDTPVMFAKRWIGTQEPLRMGARTLTAREAATIVLRHLKATAEQALGRPVRRAVVTHPAYFDRNQVDETRQAAIDAGFDMSLEREQMMMEPTAAALAYLRSETADPLRVVTYDLGGGTFDVTVLERREGIIQMIAFDGDHLLGGYNFDRALVAWILARVEAMGRKIPYDEKDPGDRGRRARLLQIAEQVKINLSEQRTDKVPVQVQARGLLVDVDGKPVQVAERITREQYAALIRDDLDKTVECTVRAMAKAAKRLVGDSTPAFERLRSGEPLSTVLEEEHLTIEGVVRGLQETAPVARLLLVGGSTWGPWVEAAVRRAFPGVEVKRWEPDACVGAGAALQAGDLPQGPASASVGGQRVSVALTVPPTTPLPTVPVAGAVTAEDGSALPPAACAGLAFLVRLPTGETVGPVAADAEGRFLFEEIALLDGSPTELALLVRDSGGAVVLEHPFTVERTDEATADIPPVLPKSIFVRVRNGLVLLADEGKDIPVRCEPVSLKTIHAGEDIDIPVVQGDLEVGKIVISGIPAEAGARCPVVLELEVNKKNRLVGKARVLRASGGAVAAEANVEISFPPVRVKDLGELRSEYEQLESERLQAIERSQDPKERARLGGAAKKLSQRILARLSEQEPDKQEIARDLRELAKLVRPSREELDPPFRRLGEILQQARDAISEGDAQAASFEPALKRLEADGEEAYRTKSQRRWSGVIDGAEDLLGRIRKAAKPGTVTPPPPKPTIPPTEQLKEMARMEVDQWRGALKGKRHATESRADVVRVKARLDKVAADIDKADAEIDRIPDSLPNEQALARVQSILGREGVIRRAIDNADVTVEKGE